MEPKLRLNPNRRRRSQAGFSLIELIMAIVVVGIVAIPVSLLMAEFVPAVVSVNQQLAAESLARREMAVVKTENYDALQNAVFSNYLNSGYDVVRTVTFVFGNAGSAESLKQIDVSVRPAGTLQTLVTLTTYRARNVSIGS